MINVHSHDGADGSVAPEAASLCPHHHVLFTAGRAWVLLLPSVISSDGTGGMDCNIPAHLSTPRDGI